MKKNNVYFIGECIVIALLLLIVGILIRDESNAAIGREVNGQEQNVVVVEETEEFQSTVEESTDSGQLVNVKEAANISESEESISQNEILAEEEEREEEENEEEKTRIVVFGDSIWNAGRGKDGISERIMEQTNTKIYNCSIGGTTAAVPEGESTQWDNWTSKSFNGMMYIANGAIEAEEIIAEDAACEIIKEIDFSTIDYVIVSYGLNDYFSDIPIYPETYYDETSYVGALRHGAHKLQEQYPQLEVILTSPTYCEWFKGERKYDLGAYVEAARSVAQELDLHFLDMYHALGKNPEEKMEYLSDGVHLNDEGMALYANWIVECLKEIGVE